MKKIGTVAILLALGAGATPASAQTLITGIKGSDTLEPPTSDILANHCGDAAIASVLTYAGGGSGGGETNLVNGTQLIAPMSSALSTTACTTSGASTNAQAMVVGLDGIAIVAQSASSQNCGGGHTARTTDPATVAPTPAFSGLKFSGAFTAGTSGYTVGGIPAGGVAADETKWKDILRVLFTGYDTTMAKPDSSVAGPPGNCNSQIRKDLANNFVNLWQTGCTANANCPNGIKHAYRRNDLSGTTDTFLGLLGAPKLTKTSGVVTNTPFCNGTDAEDNDPIRRPCDDSEQVCEFDGTLGLVVPISVPTFSNDKTQLYNAEAVPQAGRFLIAAAPSCGAPKWIEPGVKPWPSPAPAISYGARCDCRFPHPNDFKNAGLDFDGNPLPMGATPVRNPKFNWNTRVGTGCQVPTTETNASSTTNRWGRVTGRNSTNADNNPIAWGNRGAASSANPGKCCVVAINGVDTFTPMDPRLMNLVVRNPNDGTIRTNTGSTVPLTVSFHRIHSTANGVKNVAVATGADLCNLFSDATQGIGCMVERVPTEKCSVGFAGLDASDKVFADRAALQGVDPTTETIQNLVGVGTPYPLARRLYLNTLQGFGTMGETASVHSGSANVFQPSTATAGSQQIIRDASYNLAKCFYHDYLETTPAITKAGFIPLPANSGKALCLDVCGATTCGTPATSLDTIFSR